MLMPNWREEECGVCYVTFAEGVEMHIYDVSPRICEECWTTRPDECRALHRRVEKLFLSELEYQHG